MIGTRNGETINHLIQSFTRQNQDLVKYLIQLQYWFRGALSRDDAYAMSPVERELAQEFLNKRFDDAKDAIKKGAPVFL